MKENIKIGLLGIITLTVVINTFFMDDTPERVSNASNNTATPVSSIATNPTQLQTNVPTTVNPATIPNDFFKASNFVFELRSL